MMLAFLYGVAAASVVALGALLALPKRSSKRRKSADLPSIPGAARDVQHGTKA